MAHIHLIGIGGIGLSAIATVLLQQQHTVSGSDEQDSANVQRLRQLGANITIGHSPQNITTPDVVVTSSAIPPNNLEVIAANAKNIPVIKRPAWLGQMMANSRGIAIAGTHGKTTTTAMLAYILTQAKRSPTYIVGGIIPQLKGNAGAGQSDLFVIEADEYDRTFLSLKPTIGVITNIEWDHPDTYPTETLLQEAFKAFAHLIPADGTLIGCGDDMGVQTLLRQHPQAITYGLDDLNMWQAVNLQLNLRGGYTFEIKYQGQLITPKPIAMSVPGLHNVKNGLAAFIVAHRVGLEPNEITIYLSAFAGTNRRFELKGEINGITVIDDYAHHPTEIEATLAAARARFGSRPIWAVFQPHTYSRTKLFLEQFAAAFSNADHVIILDIFPSREKDDGSISSVDILTRMKHPDARYLASFNQTITYLANSLSPNDVLTTLGAGNSYKIGEAILEKLTIDDNGRC